MFLIVKMIFLWPRLSHNTTRYSIEPLRSVLFGRTTIANTATCLSCISFFLDLMCRVFTNFFIMLHWLLWRVIWMSSLVTHFGTEFCSHCIFTCVKDNCNCMSNTYVQWKLVTWTFAGTEVVMHNSHTCPIFSAKKIV